MKGPLGNLVRAGCNEAFFRAVSITAGLLDGASADHKLLIRESRSVMKGPRLAAEVEFCVRAGQPLLLLAEASRPVSEPFPGFFVVLQILGRDQDVLVSDLDAA